MPFWKAQGEIKLVPVSGTQLAGGGNRAADFCQSARCPFEIKC
jgi:hypothetical protein|tara:strand:+ start:1614 stop:1742 length:129 start_codon:yes stop_codon:yes gene_type:complete